MSYTKAACCDRSIKHCAVRSCLHACMNAVVSRLVSRADLLKKKSAAVSSLEAELKAAQLKITMLDQQLDEKTKVGAAR